MLRWLHTQSPLQYARALAQSRSRRFFGVPIGSCGIFAPNTASNELFNRIGIYALVYPDSHSSSTESQKAVAVATKFCEVYNPEMLRCLIAQHHPEVRRARKEALQELEELLKADPIQDASKASKGYLYFMSIDGYAPKTPGLKSLPEKAGMKPLKAFPALLQGSEHSLLASVVQRYVIPYNRYLLHSHRNG